MSSNSMKHKRMLLLFLLLVVSLVGTGGICTTEKAKPVILERDCIERFVGLDYALVIRYTVRNDGDSGYIKVVGVITNSGRYQKEARFYLNEGQSYSGELVFTKPTIWETYGYSVGAFAE